MKGKDDEKKEDAQSSSTPNMNLMKGNGPMLATLRIKELDKLVFRLKQNSLNCQASIHADEVALKQIDDEIAKIKVRYDPLVKELDERIATKNMLVSESEKVSKSMSKLLGDAKSRLSSSSHASISQLRKTASLELRAARGYH